MPGTVLVIHSDTSSAGRLAGLVEEAGLEAVLVATASQAVGALQSDAVDFVLCDVALPDRGARHILVTARLRRPPVPVVAVSARADLDAAVDAFRFGACDFWVEPIDPAALEELGRLAIEARRRPASLEAMRDRLAADGSERIVGTSAALREATRGYQRAHITRILEMVGGHREQAARLLGINPATLYRKLNELGMHNGGAHASSAGRADHSEATLAD